jgi:hypothetical protein
MPTSHLLCDNLHPPLSVEAQEHRRLPDNSPVAPSCVERDVMRLIFGTLGFRTTKIWPEAAWLRCLTDTR